MVWLGWCISFRDVFPEDESYREFYTRSRWYARGRRRAISQIRAASGPFKVALVRNMVYRSIKPAEVPINTSARRLPVPTFPARTYFTSAVSRVSQILRENAGRPIL